MTVRQAIAQANTLRPNTLSDEIKSEWLNRVDGEMAQMMGKTPPQNKWPEDAPLLMPHPHDELYVLYLCARIDYYNQETTEYQNDMESYNQAVANARAWWRRENKPQGTQYVRAW